MAGQEVLDPLTIAALAAVLRNLADEMAALRRAVENQSQLIVLLHRDIPLVWSEADTDPETAN